MKKYKCVICGYIHEGEMDEDFKCPICGAPKNMFEELNEEKKDVSYIDNSREKYINEIREMASTGKMIINAMGTEISKVSWEDILILGAALNPMPLLETESVNLKTIIGKNALKPLEIDMPVYISHMSFGALSSEAKTALAIGSKSVKTAMCSGEGGVLESEKENSYKYIFEYVPNKYSVTDEMLKNVDAIEIKISQGTKPGMGGHLPGEKVTEEIARIRNKEVGKDIISPSRFLEIKTKEDLKNLIDDLRKKSGGVPVGVKIAAGHIESDLEFITYAKPDFITIDGRGGATGASPKVIKDSTSVPTIYALYRARKYLDENNTDIDLIITGGLRLSSDIAKAIALGANAVAVATAPMIALGCEQYRVCHLGNCPKGIATQDKNLRKNLNVEEASKKVENYFKALKEELETFSRLTGKDDIHKLNVNDLVTINSEISENTNIKHA